MQNRLKKIAEEQGKDSGQLEAEKNTFKIFQILKGFRGHYGLDFAFAIIFGSHFESNYKKLAINDVFVELAPNHVVRLEKTLPVYAASSSEEEQQGLFYIYTSRKNIKKLSKDNKSITSLLIKYIAVHWDDEVEIDSEAI